MLTLIDNAMTATAVVLGLIAFISGLALFATDGGTTSILIFDLGLVYIALGLANSWLSRRWRANVAAPRGKRTRIMLAKAVVVLALTPAALLDTLLIVGLSFWTPGAG